MKKTHLIIHELQCKGWFSYSSTSNHYHFVDNGWLLRLWHLGGDIFWLLRSKSQAAAHDKTNQLSVIIQCNPDLTKILKEGCKCLTEQWYNLTLCDCSRPLTKIPQISLTIQCIWNIKQYHDDNSAHMRSLTLKLSVLCHSITPNNNPIAMH